MTSLNHNFYVSESNIFLPKRLDTLAGVLPVVSWRQHFRYPSDLDMPPQRSDVRNVPLAGPDDASARE
jgi:hypothetical protein